MSMIERQCKLEKQRSVEEEDSGGEPSTADTLRKKIG